ncbi:putative membrane protein [Novosphingobium sp. PhB165]|uniref:TMEM175 family protein n=1 Tax=Novosphingobium sp. PhB165 TaxID=2485105 RepID=UPI00104D79A6|nr:TMEM175 family protein [Novosphingobium sp. PhB165]TCM21953.1 putative membrane protein [Novosphingobium sp. PhB165]
MNDVDDIEREDGVARVEAFSDGVLAIIITIMVLELKAPTAEGLAAFWPLWPVFLAYALSYAYVAIYWVNHHRLFSHARVITSGLVWANMLLLFTLSLIPISTAYLGEHHFSREATVIYLVTMFVPALAYVTLQGRVAATGARNRASRVYHRASRRKGLAASAVYALGIPLSFITPWLGVACAALVAVFWMLPWSRLDRLFLACED